MEIKALDFSERTDLVGEISTRQQQIEKMKYSLMMSNHRCMQTHVDRKLDEIALYPHWPAFVCSIFQLNIENGNCMHLIIASSQSSWPHSIGQCLGGEHLTGMCFLLVATQAIY